MHYFPPQAARVALTYGDPSVVEALPPLPPTHAGGVSLRPVESAVVFLGLGAARGLWWDGVPGVADVLAPHRPRRSWRSPILVPTLSELRPSGVPLPPAMFPSRWSTSSLLKSKWSARFWQFPGRGCPTREEG